MGPHLVILVGPPCAGKTTFIEGYLATACSSTDRARWVTIHEDNLVALRSGGSGGGLHRRNKSVWRAMFPSVPFGYASAAVSGAASGDYSPSTIPSREELLSVGVYRNIILDGCNASALQRTSLFEHLCKELARFPSMGQGYAAGCALGSYIRFTVIHFEDSSRGRVPQNMVSHGRARHQLFGYRLADGCLSMATRLALDRARLPDDEGKGVAVEHGSLDLPSASLFGAPGNGPPIDRPSMDEGMHALLTVYLVDEVGDRRRSAAIGLAASRRIVAGASPVAPLRSLGMGFFSTERSQVTALFVPASLLISFVQSRRVEGVRPVLVPAVLKALWQWAGGGRDNRRVVIISGAIPTVSQGRVEGSLPDASQRQSVGPIAIAHKMVQQLFEGLQLPIPLFSFSVHMTPYGGAGVGDSVVASAPSTHWASQQQHQSTAGDFLPLDACSMAYLERLLYLDIPQCVGLSALPMDGREESKDARSIFGFACVDSQSFVASSGAMDSCVVSTPNWTDWSAHPCFAVVGSDGRRLMRNRASDAIEHPFGNHLSGTLQCHSAYEMPCCFASILSNSGNGEGQRPPLPAECGSLLSCEGGSVGMPQRRPMASGTLIHKSSLVAATCPDSPLGERAMRRCNTTAYADVKTDSPSECFPSLSSHHGLREGAREAPRFICSVVGVSSFFGQSAMENGRAYAEAGQMVEGTVRLWMGGELPRRPLVVGSADQWRGSAEPSALAHAAVTAMVWSSDRSSQYECTMLVDMGASGGLYSGGGGGGGRPVACFCTCGTATSLYGGNHCRHCAALAVVLCQRTRGMLALEEVLPAAPANLGIAAHASADGGPPAAAAGPMDGGAASRSTYVPTGMPLLVNGIPQFLVSRAGRRGAAVGEAGTGSTGARSDVGQDANSRPLKLLTAHGIPSRKVPLGPSAPTRRPLTAYFWFMRSSLSAGEGGAPSRDPQGRGGPPDGCGTAGSCNLLALRSSFFSYPAPANSPQVVGDRPPPGDGVPAAKVRVTEITRQLAKEWRALSAVDRARVDAECAAYNAGVKEEWERYKASDECKLAIAAYASGAGGGSAGGRRSSAVGLKRGRGAVVPLGEDDETDDEGGSSPMVSPTRAPPQSNAGEWRRNSRGEWVCEWDSDAPEEEDLTDIEVSPRSSHRVSPQRHCSRGGALSHSHPRRAPVLGSFVEGDGDGEAADSGLGDVTRGSTLANLGQETTDGSIIVRRGTSRYLSH